MVKPLLFKGDKKPKKRKAEALKDFQDRPEADHPIVNDSITDDDTWVAAEAPTDLLGPIVIVLPSSKPSCIACDVNGKVFASHIESILDDDPATVEPHDARQVWLANQIAGTDEISFKGHHGRYLSCDQIGQLSATREAISPEETFRCIPLPDIQGSFSIQNAREKFIGLVEDSKGNDVRGDAESIAFATTLKIRMQARFKPRVKASREQKTKERVSRKELEETVGRRLEDGEVRKLKKARMQGNYHEAILDVRVKGKHDKYT